MRSPGNNGSPGRIIRIDVDHQRDRLSGRADRLQVGLLAEAIR